MKKEEFNYNNLIKMLSMLKKELKKESEWRYNEYIKMGKKNEPYTKEETINFYMWLDSDNLRRDIIEITEKIARHSKKHTKQIIKYLRSIEDVR
ncbi:MAG: hypothetical protein MJ191_05735 [Clostridium sp.]|nr:hypothetical protein [Clostridium sp.]